MPALVLFGSGPGIGNHVAAAFAAKGFNHIILVARNTSRLGDDAAFVKSKASGVKIDTLSLDLSDISAIPATLQKIEELAPEIEVVYYNAAVVKPNPVLEVPIEEMEKDFRVNTVALYVIAQWAIPRLQALSKSNSSAKPSLFATNSHLPWDPVPPYLSLSLVKAAQRNLVMNLYRAYGESGVHIGLVNAEGIVSPEKPNLNPANIAQKAVVLYEGKDFEVSVKE